MDCEIRGSGKRTRPSQGERRTPTDTQGGRGKVGFQIPMHIFISVFLYNYMYTYIYINTHIYICINTIYKYPNVSDRTDESVCGVLVAPHRSRILFSHWKVLSMRCQRVSIASAKEADGVSTPGMKERFLTNTVRNPQDTRHE